MRCLLPLLFLAAPLAAQDLKALPPPAIAKMMSPKPPKQETRALPPPERAIITNEIRYYIDSPHKLVVTSSPPGYFEALEKKGPLTVVTKFSDDPSVIAEKEFKGPFVYWLKPKKTGPCEILAMPEKIATEKDILRQLAEVDDGTKPIPPPKVDPKVDPVPDQKPAPIAGDGYQVLIKFNNKINMPENVFTTIYGPKVTAWMNANVAKGPTGEPERRVWPADVDMSKAPQKWQDAMKRPSQGDWWVIISNGVTGTEQPLPIGEDAFIELLN